MSTADVQGQLNAQASISTGLRSAAAASGSGPSIGAAGVEGQLQSGGVQKQMILISEEDLEARIDARVRIREAAIAGGFSLHKRKREITVPRPTRGAVRKASLRLLGCKGKTKPGPFPGTRPYYDLPRPLSEGGERRTTPSGDLLHHPEWDMAVDQGVNAEFIDAVVNVILESGVTTYELKPTHIAEPGLVKCAAEQFFRHLKRQYEYRNTEKGLKRFAKKIQLDRRQGRRSRKTDRRRRAVPIFRRAFGHANTVGVEELIQTPLMSSEASTDGEADTHEREHMRKEQGAGHRALEVRTFAIRAKQVDRLYGALDAINAITNIRPNESSSPGDDSDDESSGVNSDSEADNTGTRRRRGLCLGQGQAVAEEDLTDNERATYRSELQAKIRAKHGRGELHYDRFRGPSANHRTAVRRTKKNIQLYKEFFREEMMSVCKSNKRTYQYAHHAPTSLTTLQLSIPSEFFLDDDQGWLGDSEEGSGL